MTTTTESQITSGKAESIDIEKLRELAQAAKPGPWKYNPVTTGVECDFDDEDACSSIVYVTSGDFTKRLTIAHGQFIAAANPAVILALIDRIAHIEAVREKDRAAAFESGKRHAHEQACKVTHSLMADRDHFKAIAERQAAGLRAAIEGLMDFAPDKRAQPDGMTRGGPYIRKADVISILSPAQQERAKEK